MSSMNRYHGSDLDAEEIIFDTKGFHPRPFHDLPSGGRIASGKGLGASIARSAGAGELPRAVDSSSGRRKLHRRGKEEEAARRGKSGEGPKQTREGRKKRGGEDGGRGGREKERKRGASGAMSGRCR